MMPEQHSPESIRGDLEVLAAVLKKSWSEDQNRSLRYDESFLRTVFAYPGTSFDLTPTIYTGLFS